MLCLCMHVYYVCMLCMYAMYAMYAGMYMCMCMCLCLCIRICINTYACVRVCWCLYVNRWETMHKVWPWEEEVQMRRKTGMTSAAARKCSHYWACARWGNAGGAHTFGFPEINLLFFFFWGGAPRSD